MKFRYYLCLSLKFVQDVQRRGGTMNYKNRFSGPVLILGETGTGKTTMAKEIHRDRAGSYKPFYHLNISSLNKNLFESELFGHKKGAFSGATGDKKGFLEAAGEGTVFLDEIGELGLEEQAKLLTVIEEKEYYPVGSYVKKHFSGRFIFATNKDLEALVKEGNFREDLYFRIRYCQYQLKPLRAERNKINIIINQWEQLQRDEKRVRMGQAVLNELFKYNWPGNYRELKNTLNYVYDISDEEVNLVDLPDWIMKGNLSSERVDTKHHVYQVALENFERNYFDIAMNRNQGKINRTAEDIGISKVTLISKLRKYGIDREQYKCINTMAKVNGF